MIDLRTTVLDGGYRRLLRPVLFAQGGGDPEVAHERTMSGVRLINASAALRTGVAALHAGPRSEVVVSGIRFPGRVGLAAGLDKFAVGPRAWGSLGFSHVELGTVTARPQPGNPKPRLFRATASRAIVNRMGFNNPGAEPMAHTLASNGIRRGNGVAGIPLGISLGKSKVAPLGEAVEDYLFSFERLAPFADYLAINVSSPNTPGLRTLQDGGALRSILAALVGASKDRAQADGKPAIPLWVKIAPDLESEAIDEVLDVCQEAGAGGIIATNTTLQRTGLAARDAGLAEQAGGLSGAPLADRSLSVVEHLARRSELPIIGVGGIMGVGDARRMLDAGASLLQLYTGYLYAGPALVRGINAMTVARDAELTAEEICR